MVRGAVDSKDTRFGDDVANLRHERRELAERLDIVRPKELVRQAGNRGGAFDRLDGRHVGSFSGEQANG